MKKFPILIFIVIAAEFFIFVACERQVQTIHPSNTNRQKSTITWYQLIDGKFEEISETSPAIPVKQEPWTVQQSIRDIITVDNTAFMGINGYGIASVSFKDSPYPLFRYYYDPIIFKYRTITTLLPFENSIICHVYFNQTLNVTSQESLKIQGISLVKLIPRYENYKFIIVPFQRINPDWESVTFLPLSNTQFLFEWKHTSSKRTKFKYTSLNIMTMGEKSITRLDFLSSYHITQISNCKDKSLKRLLYFVKNKLKEPSIIHFHLRTPTTHIDKIYIYTPREEKNFNLVSITLLKTPNFYYTLLPDNKYFKTGPCIYRIKTNEKTIQKIELPQIPPGYTYTTFNLLRNKLLVGWEQNSFTNVKRSGLLILDYQYR